MQENYLNSNVNERTYAIVTKNCCVKISIIF